MSGGSWSNGETRGTWGDGRPEPEVSWRIVNEAGDMLERSDGRMSAQVVGGIATIRWHDGESVIASFPIDSMDGFLIELNRDYCVPKAGRR